jgi:hypothetical protein
MGRPGLGPELKNRFTCLPETAVHQQKTPLRLLTLTPLVQDEQKLTWARSEPGERFDIAKTGEGRYVVRDVSGDPSQRSL